MSGSVSRAGLELWVEAALPERVGSGQGGGLGWALTPRTNRRRPLGRPTIRARWEAAAREAVSGETCAADTPSGNRHLSQRDLYLNTVI